MPEQANPKQATRDLLIEIGCEELPPKSLDTLARAFFDGLASEFEQAQIAFDAAESRVLASPRRLALRFGAVAERQPDQVQERRGPAVAAAFDADGRPTKAALGFARSVGREVEALERLETDKGAWLACRVEQAGAPLSDLLFPMLERALAALPVPKPMRWADHDYHFVRPVHWVAVLHGDEVLEGTLMGLPAGRSTRGHRIHAPGPHDITEPAAYLEVLRGASVLADPRERRERIREMAEAAGRAAGGRARVEDALLDEVNNLVEWPVAVTGRFSEAFLEVPSEALIASMQDHQKCFPVFDEAGNLMPVFIAVSNLESEDPGAVREGYERVIRPRLADARFFWEQDLKTPLSSLTTRLEEIVFQKDLGSVGDKTRRIASISQTIADHVGANAEQARRAAELSRADLVTLMVNEFPELQGVMGGHYAAAAGEPDAVRDAVAAFYQPAFAGDDIPPTVTGRVLGVADRLDTLVGVFAAGLKPTGNKDPFALRRAALGALRILREGALDIELDRCLAIVANALADTIEVTPPVLEEVREFMLERLRQHCREQGYGIGEIRATLSAPLTTLTDFMARLEAVHAFLARPEAESLAAANKRIGNILRKSEDPVKSEIDEDRLHSDHEKGLFDEVVSLEKSLEPLWGQGHYGRILGSLAGLRERVDRFFDHVMVMDEDPAVRANRLALLARLKALFDRVADFALVD